MQPCQRRAVGRWRSNTCRSPNCRSVATNSPANLAPPLPPPPLPLPLPMPLHLTFPRNGPIASFISHRAIKLQYQSQQSQQSMKQHSTSTMDFVHSFPSVVSLQSTTATTSSSPPLKPPARPATAELRTLFVASAIPMIGFGFMDQFVLIQAGGYIDATLGVSLGLATMTAAAAGQVVSDVSGVVFGGALERFLTRLSLIQAPNLTMQQRQLPICRNVSMLGAVVGVILGCALGATTLLTVDLEARHRVERAQRLRDIVADMIVATDQPHGDGSLNCESCTVYVVSTKHLTPPKDDKQHATTTMELISESSPRAVKQCINSREVAFGTDDRRRRSVLYAPLVKLNPDNGEAEVMAVISFRHRSSISSSSSTSSSSSSTSSSNNNADGFTDDDVLTCRVMSKHISIFMDRLGD